jgi:hypothetical protein
METKINALSEYKKWLHYDTRLIFTNCGALTWYLRKAWLLENAPELMPISAPSEPFEIRRSIKNRLAKAEYYTHVWIRARLAFVERLFAHRPIVPQPSSALGLVWSDDPADHAPEPAAPSEEHFTFRHPGKPRLLKAADKGHQWIYFTWKWPRSNATRLGYRLERSRHKGGPYQTIAMTHACDLLITPVSSQTEFFYRVRAFNPSGEGPASSPISSTAF